MYRLSIKRSQQWKNISCTCHTWKGSGHDGSFAVLFINAPPRTKTFLICNPTKHGPEIGKHMQMKDLSPKKDIEVKSVIFNVWNFTHLKAELWRLCNKIRTLELYSFLPQNTKYFRVSFLIHSTLNYQF